MMRRGRGVRQRSDAPELRFTLRVWRQLLGLIGPAIGPIEPSTAAGSFICWLDNFAMNELDPDERERAPVPDSCGGSASGARVDELISNNYATRLALVPELGLDNCHPRQPDIWIIDHTGAFAPATLQDSDSLVRCPRLCGSLRSLNRAATKLDSVVLATTNARLSAGALWGTRTRSEQGRSGRAYDLHPSEPPRCAPTRVCQRTPRDAFSYAAR